MEARSVAFDLGDSRTLPLLRITVDGCDTLMALVPLGLDGFDRVEAIRQLLSRLHGRAVPADTRLTRQQRRRQRRMLQAIDGSRSGATHQEIAQVVLHAERVNRDEWQASSARHAVAALLRDARALIAGGYRRLLRHRRQP
ncbi:DUF2285 domain-containing protein [Sphingomonas adhaesiva]|uniref:DUF2285 domain-containing protein n=1 Tax=Sphingomonas adhaesiva TaxID=28212 RepID=UPI002FF8CFA1